MNLYTGRGDYGKTNLIGGRAVSKDDIRIEAYGTLDELNSFVGYAINLSKGINETVTNELINIQHYLFDSGTDLADHDKRLESKVSTEDVTWLEKRIDFYTENTKKLKKFILPGGSQLSAILQICRTITRRAERSIVTLMNEAEINNAVFVFINRLSDYFFAVARYINEQEGIEEPLYERGGNVFHND